MCFQTSANEGPRASVSFGVVVADVELRRGFSDVASSRELAAAAASPDALRVHFKPTVSCCEVPSIREISREGKAVLWWQPGDFAEFLRNRLDIVQTCAEDRRSSKVAAFEFHAGPGDDCIRPLRKSTIKSYFRTVLTEQAKQRVDAKFKKKPFDPDRLAQVGIQASAQQVQYAIERANNDRLAARRASSSELLSVEKQSSEGGSAMCPQVSILDDGVASAMTPVPSYDLVEKSESHEDETKRSAQGFGQDLPRLLQDRRTRWAVLRSVSFFVQRTSVA